MLGKRERNDFTAVTAVSKMLEELIPVRLRESIFQEGSDKVRIRMDLTLGLRLQPLGYDFGQFWHSCSLSAIS